MGEPQSELGLRPDSSWQHRPRHLLRSPRLQSGQARVTDQRCHDGGWNLRSAFPGGVRATGICSNDADHLSGFRRAGWNLPSPACSPLLPDLVHSSGDSFCRRDHLSSGFGYARNDDATGRHCAAFARPSCCDGRNYVTDGVLPYDAAVF